MRTRYCVCIFYNVCPSTKHGHLHYMNSYLLDRGCAGFGDEQGWFRSFASSVDGDHLEGIQGVRQQVGDDSSRVCHLAFELSKLPLGFLVSFLVHHLVAVFGVASAVVRSHPNQCDRAVCFFERVQHARASQNNVAILLLLFLLLSSEIRSRGRVVALTFAFWVHICLDHNFYPLTPGAVAPSRAGKVQCARFSQKVGIRRSKICCQQLSIARLEVALLCQQLVHIMILKEIEHQSIIDFGDNGVIFHTGCPPVLPSNHNSFPRMCAHTKNREGREKG
mmetsp:Transcript_3479/g.6591  ORF Transcript_3479/g.6591 Transcript_3479/m.6591 type:complete len:278 (+) Transcript_3479:300-1133(+)